MIALIIGGPSLLFWRMVSSYNMVPLIHSPKPRVVTSNSRQSRREASGCGMANFANRLLQVGLLSSIASKPLLSANRRLTVSVKIVLFIGLYILNQYIA